MCARTTCLKASSRRAPYADYPLTYSAVTGAEVHNDGEIYAAIVWRLIELFTKKKVPLGGFSRLTMESFDGE